MTHTIEEPSTQRAGMIFTRERFYGLDFDWYGIDADGTVAKFTTGHASIPKYYFSSESLYEKIDSYFNLLPEITDSHLSPQLLASKFAHGNFSYAIKDARKGLCIFDCFDSTESYYLISIPEQSIKMSELPQEVQNFLEHFTFSDVKFAEIAMLDIRGYFHWD